MTAAVASDNVAAVPRCAPSDPLWSLCSDLDNHAALHICSPWLSEPTVYKLVQSTEMSRPAPCRQPSAMPMQSCVCTNERAVRSGPCSITVSTCILGTIVADAQIAEGKLAVFHLRPRYRLAMGTLRLKVSSSTPGVVISSSSPSTLSPQLLHLFGFLPIPSILLFAQ
jgi:hypothetical protein